MDHQETAIKNLQGGRDRRRRERRVENEYENEGDGEDEEDLVLPKYQPKRGGDLG